MDTRGTTEEEGDVEDAEEAVEEADTIKTRVNRTKKKRILNSTKMKKIKKPRKMKKMITVVADSPSRTSFSPSDQPYKKSITRASKTSVYNT